MATIGARANTGMRLSSGASTAMQEMMKIAWNSIMGVNLLLGSNSQVTAVCRHTDRRPNLFQIHTMR